MRKSAQTRIESVIIDLSAPWTDGDIMPSLLILNELEKIGYSPKSHVAIARFITAMRRVTANMRIPFQPFETDKREALEALIVATFVRASEAPTDDGRAESTRETLDTSQLLDFCKAVIAVSRGEIAIGSAMDENDEIMISFQGVTAKAVHIVRHLREINIRPSVLLKFLGSKIGKSGVLPPDTLEIFAENGLVTEAMLSRIAECSLECAPKDTKALGELLNSWKASGLPPSEFKTFFSCGSLAAYRQMKERRLAPISFVPIARPVVKECTVAGIKLPAVD